MEYEWNDINFQYMADTHNGIIRSVLSDFLRKKENVQNKKKNWR